MFLFIFLLSGMCHDSKLSLDHSYLHSFFMKFCFLHCLVQSFGIICQSTLREIFLTFYFAYAPAVDVVNYRLCDVDVFYVKGNIHLNS